jgi:hypothetical protein
MDSQRSIPMVLSIVGQAGVWNVPSGTACEGAQTLEYPRESLASARCAEHFAVARLRSYRQPG